MKGIVLAGGTGSRLFPITNVVLKQLVPVYDKPLIYYPMSLLMFAGITDILIISNPAHISALEHLFGNGEGLGLNISYKIQEHPGGIAEAFLLGEAFIGKDDVCLTLGDNIFYGDKLIQRIRAARQIVEEERCSVQFSYFVKNPQEYGVVEYDSDGQALSVEEKPNSPKSNYAITGLGFYTSDVIDIAKRVEPSARGELENTDILRHYMDQSRLQIIPLGRGDAWLDAGTPEMLLEASNFVRTIERRQGLKIACLEEIAFNMGMIDEGVMQEHIDKYANSEYGDYLQKVKDGQFLGAADSLKRLLKLSDFS
jgi:glucose-1-phosphate thymidylyltransferase